MLSGTWNRETVLGSIPAIYIYNIMVTIYCHLITIVYFFIFNIRDISISFNILGYQVLNNS